MEKHTANRRNGQGSHYHSEVCVIWDESVIEKPEILKAERLCAVRSSKARRLKRIKPGYYNPPTGRPVFVPGLNWLQIILTGMKGTHPWEHRAKLLALAALVQAFLFSPANLALGSLVSPNRKAEPLDCSSALPLTFGVKPTLARLPTLDSQD